MKAYQMKITIKNSKPPHWRRVIVPMGITFEQLHRTIIESFCWSGYHLYEFELPKQYIRAADDEEMEDFYDIYNEYDTISVKEVIDNYLEVGDKLAYNYDFGDDWNHQIVIEKRIDDWNYRYPQVIKYKGECIPEDCGGIDGYYQLLMELETGIITNGMKDANELHEWAEAQGMKEYDMSEVNEQMKLELVFPVAEGKISNKAKNGHKEKELSIENLVDKSFSTSNIKGKEYQAIADAIKKMAEEYKVELLSKVRNQESTLTDIYQYYTKEEIIEIAKINYIGRYSYYTKKDLIPYVISEMLKPTCIERLFLYLHDEEIKAFDLAEKTNGRVGDLAEDAFAALLAHGYAGITSVGDILIPNEVYEVYHSFSSETFHKKRRRITLVGDYCNGLCELYGVTPMEQVIEVFNQYEKVKLDDNEIFDLYYGGFSRYSNFMIIGRLLVMKELVDDNAYKNLLKKQGEKSYYIPTRQEILELGKYGSGNLTNSMKKLFKYFTEEMYIDQEDAVQACWEIDKHISWGCRMQDVFDVLEEYGIVIANDKQIGKLVPLINDVWNNTRMIDNRGFTPNEMTMQSNRKAIGKSNVISFEKAKQNSKKIYPNDPCPCGSGKKYKYCCGKKNN